jgi:hypothetical protein
MPCRRGQVCWISVNDPSYGNTAGTVTGEIDGLTDNSTGAAADVIIKTAPSALGNDQGPLPIDLTATKWYILSNSFTVSGGQITAASFGAVAHNFKGDLYFNQSSQNLLSLDDLTTKVENQGGLAAVTFTSLAAAPAAVPEPASFQIGFASLPILGLWVWKKRRTAAV